MVAKGFTAMGKPSPWEQTVCVESLLIKAHKLVTAVAVFEYSTQVLLWDITLSLLPCFVVTISYLNLCCCKTPWKQLLDRRNAMI